ncbi:MAG TPA: hypothetical protein VEU30_16235, partial [Thermoanaerobaculia bacterium]|nr:hypothetical protein [Thermoanaerobaculia bacterium]
MRKVLLLGFDAADAARLEELVAISGDGRDVVCLGPALSGRDAVTVLAQHPNARHIVLAAGNEPELFQDFIDSDSLFFLSRRPPPLDEIAALLRSALAHDERRARLDAGADRGALVVSRAIARLVDRIATETDLQRISGLVGNTVSALTDADDAHFAIVDALHETLWFRALDASDVVRNS